MSDVTNCSTCGAVCQIVGNDDRGVPKLQALQAYLTRSIAVNAGLIRRS